MHLHRAIVLARFPVPEPQLALCISTAQELSIGGESQTACIARAQVASELFLAVHLEVAFAVIDNNLVVHRLACEVFLVWMHRGRGHCVHVWLAYVLGHNGDAKFPHVHLLVVGSRNEASSVLNESYCVNGAQMLLILLHNFLRVRIKLQDLFVRATC